MFYSIFLLAFNGIDLILVFRYSQGNVSMNRNNYILMFDDVPLKLLCTRTYHQHKSRSKTHHFPIIFRAHCVILNFKIWIIIFVWTTKYGNFKRMAMDNLNKSRTEIYVKWMIWRIYSHFTTTSHWTHWRIGVILFLR